MSTQRPDILFIENFFKGLKQQDISYCIMRNAHEVAAGDAHDVDLCICDKKLHQAEQLLEEQAKLLNWKLHLKTGSANDKSNIKCYNYYHMVEETQEIYVVHIDVFPTYAWKGYEILPNELLLENVNTETLYHSIEAETEAVCNLFVRLLYNGKIKDKYKPNIQNTFLNNKARVCEIMRHFLSQELTEYIYHCAIAQKWDAIDDKRSAIIKSVKKRSKRKLFTYVTYLLSKALKRTGLIVVFQGTDGSGKTTIINGIEQVLGNTFSNNTLNYYHWRPGFVKSEKRLDSDGKVVSNVQPHTLPPAGKLMSLAKMLLYTADYVLGYWLKIYWQSAQGHLVVFDRYYYDFYMDKVRYRLNIGNWVIRLLHLFIPKPDITFVLLGDAEKIHARKKELSLGEVQRQIGLLRTYTPLFAPPIVVDVCRSIPEVVYTVASNILKRLNGQKID